jgi:hypothetical protein
MGGLEGGLVAGEGVGASVVLLFAGVTPTATPTTAPITTTNAAMPQYIIVLRLVKLFSSTIGSAELATTTTVFISFCCCFSPSSRSSFS